MKKITLLSVAAAFLFVSSCKKTEDAQPQFGTLGDHVWADVNSNGQQEAGEASMEGIKVLLYDGAGTRKIDSTTTNSAGQYLYDKLASGTYKLRFVAPTGAVSTVAGSGNGVSDSDINSLGWTRTVTIDVSKPITDTLRVNTLLDAGFRAQTSYAKDVNVILMASCQPCHVEGGGVNFEKRVKHVNNYTNAKGIATTMLDRVSRAQGAAGMMPRGGTRLSEEKIAVIRKWIEDGLAQ